MHVHCMLEVDRRCKDVCISNGAVLRHVGARRGRAWGTAWDAACIYSGGVLRPGDLYTPACVTPGHPHQGPVRRASAHWGLLELLKC